MTYADVTMTTEQTGSNIIRAPANLPHESRHLPKYARDKDRPYVGQLWDQQKPVETAKAYVAFCIYRDLDPEERTLTKAHVLYREKMGLEPKDGPGLCAGLSSRHRWRERVEAYDNYLIAKQRAAMERQKVKAAARQAKEAEDASSVVMLPIRELRRRIEEQGGQLKIVSELDDAALMKLFKALGGGAELTGLQKAERDALSSVAPVAAPAQQLQARGLLLRKVMGDSNLRGMLEKMTIEVAAMELTETTTENDDAATG